MITRDRPPDPQTCERPRLTTEGAREAAIPESPQDSATVATEQGERFPIIERHWGLPAWGRP